MPAISVICPVYNTVQYVAQAIESVVGQTFTDWQLILVDDESSDGAGELCETYAKKDVRISVIHQKNQGHGAARNAGMKRATGQYVMFFDSDDVLDGLALQALWEAVQGKDFARARFARFTKDVQHSTLVYEPACEMQTPEQILTHLIFPLLGSSQKSEKVLCGTVCTTLYKTQLLQEYHMEFTNAKQLQGEDLLFNLWFYARAHSGVSVQEVVYYYRTRRESFSNQYTPDVLDRFICLYHTTCIYLKENNLETAESINRVYAKLLDNVSVYAKNMARQPKRRAKQLLTQMVQTPSVAQALYAPAGYHQAFPLSLFCMLMRKRWFFVFRILCLCYPT